MQRDIQAQRAAGHTGSGTQRRCRNAGIQPGSGAEGMLALRAPIRPPSGPLRPTPPQPKLKESRHAMAKRTSDALRDTIRRDHAAALPSSAVSIGTLLTVAWKNCRVSAGTCVATHLHAVMGTS